MCCKIFCTTCLEKYHRNENLKNHLEMSISETDPEIFNKNKEALTNILG